MFNEPGFFRDSLEKCLSSCFVYQITIYHFPASCNMVFLVCLGDSRTNEGITKARNHVHLTFPSPTLNRSGTSNAYCFTWSSRFDMATHSNSPGSVLSCLLSFFDFSLFHSAAGERDPLSWSCRKASRTFEYAVSLATTYRNLPTPGVGFSQERCDLMASMLCQPYTAGACHEQSGLS